MRMSSLAAAAACLLLSACALPDRGAHLPTTPASGANADCEVLVRNFVYPGVRLTASQRIAAGQLRLPGIAAPMPEHCVLTGRLNERIGPVDGKTYAIGFEMRLPSTWNGRFFYQANGGLDGAVEPAYGNILGGAPTTNGLQKGFAILSSDSGHRAESAVPGIGGALFGRDPQARLDYGYNAVAQLTPMARQLVAFYYGKPAERAYLVGTSNGGRHGMVAAARDTGGFDGILASAPGFNLPRAAVAQVWDAQQFASAARAMTKEGRPDLETSFTPAELELVSQSVLRRCDALDGLPDGLVNDLMACQRAFDVMRDVPACPEAAASGSSCLDATRKNVLAKVFAGPGVYIGKPWDPGLRGSNWRSWKFVNSVGPRDAIALAFVFTTPPMSPEVVTGRGTTVADYALNFSLERDAPRIEARDTLYRESAMEFMTPPAATTMQRFVDRGGKLLVFHGAADPVFSALDTIRWYEGFRHVHGERATDSARLFLVPGMNHSSGGPATDQLDMVDALVAWVERGVAPDSVVARARGPGAAVPNGEIPADWSARRTRLLCPYPSVARYRGAGDTEVAASFACVSPS